MITIKTKIAIIICLALLFLGFMLGRLTSESEKSVEVKETVTYVPSVNIIRDTITQERLIPTNEFVRDTVVKYLTREVKVDTAAILRDYYLSRQYALDFSNDTIGTFRVDAEVNQNRLVYATSFIQPITKTVTRDKTVYRAPTIQFYGMLGTSADLSTNKISLGVDLKQRYLIGASGIRLNDKFNYTIDFGIKF